MRYYSSFKIIVSLLATIALLYLGITLSRQTSLKIHHLLLAVTIMAFGSPATIAAERQHLLSSWKGDLDKDGSIERIHVTYDRIVDGHPLGGEIIVRSNGRSKEVWRTTKLNPWKLQIADVDCDGQLEVIVGVWKKSPKDPVMAKRVFIYNWNGKRLMPKWLSSRLSRRFADFALSDVDHDGFAELFALEIMPHGKQRVSEYRWRSFGCDWLGCTGELRGFSSLRAGRNCIEMTKSGSKPVKLDLNTIHYWRRNENG